VGWYRREESIEHLPAVADAVWSDRRLRIRYESWKGLVDRSIAPLGLVVKAGEWYLVAWTGKDSPRTYRISNIRAVMTAEKFTRPRGFDLARHWAESIERFEAGLYRGTATLRASPAGLAALKHLSAAVSEAVDRAVKKADSKGWTRLTIPIESVGHAAGELLRVGAQCEVPQPVELRQRMAEAVQALDRIYKRRG
jgi:predicted DNA-binding transcriptional regulator YafY